MNDKQIKRVSKQADKVVKLERKLKELQTKFEVEKDKLLEVASKGIDFDSYDITMHLLGELKIPSESIRDDMYKSFNKALAGDTSDYPNGGVCFRNNNGIYQTIGTTERDGVLLIVIQGYEVDHDGRFYNNECYTYSVKYWIEKVETGKIEWSEFELGRSYYEDNKDVLNQVLKCEDLYELSKLKVSFVEACEFFGTHLSTDLLSIFTHQEQLLLRKEQE